MAAPMNMLSRIFTSTLGKKLLMAVTGAGLFLFVIAHMVGNLQIFLGPESINRYGHFLQTTPEILWPARIGLLALVIIHIWASISLTIENRAARATGYEVKEVVDASTASRTMIWSGLIIFAFICFHLAHYTLLIVHPDYRNLIDTQGQHDIYRMMILGFSNCWVSGFYVLSIGLLCIHLSHGTSAMFQTLGLKNPAYSCLIDCSAKVVAILIFLGYISIPVAVLAGVVK
jgi:succinate dehydrogenase cytochrome b subunit